MGKKIGNGGNGLEQYNELTGKYEAEGTSENVNGIFDGIPYQKDDSRYWMELSERVKSATGVSLYITDLFGPIGHALGDRETRFAERLCFLCASFPIKDLCFQYPSIRSSAFDFQNQRSGLMSTDLVGKVNDYDQMQTNGYFSAIMCRNIFLNPRFFHDSENGLNALLTGLADNGFHEKHSERNNVEYLLDHEYGHMCAAAAINKTRMLRGIRLEDIKDFAGENEYASDLTDDVIAYEMCCKRIIDGLGIDYNDVSQYGKSSPSETFAELFASGLSDYPTPSGTKVIEYMKGLLS